jgi:hypothetical protein
VIVAGYFARTGRVSTLYYQSPSLRQNSLLFSSVQIRDSSLFLIPLTLAFPGYLMLHLRVSEFSFLHLLLLIENQLGEGLAIIISVGRVFVLLLILKVHVRVQRPDQNTPSVLLPSAVPLNPGVLEDLAHSYTKQRVFRQHLLY